MKLYIFLSVGVDFWEFDFLYSLRVRISRTDFTHGHLGPLEISLNARRNLMFLSFLDRSASYSILSPRDPPCTQQTPIRHHAAPRFSGWNEVTPRARRRQHSIFQSSANTLSEFQQWQWLLDMFTVLPEKMQIPLVHISMFDGCTAVPDSKKGSAVARWC